MTTLPRRLTQAVISVAALTAAIGCGMFGSPSDPVQDLRALLIDRVKEPQRVEQMLGLVDRFEAKIEELNKKTETFAAELRTLNRDYDSTRAQFDQLLKRQNGEREALRDRILATTMNLRSLATPHEWEDIIDLQLESFEVRIKKTVADEEGD